MLKGSLVILPILLVLSFAPAMAQSKDGLPVEVVATATEYVPTSTTFTHAGHSYTNCMGSTSYLGQFHSYGDSGFVSGTADTNTHCETTYTPPTNTTLTNYRKLNYTIAKGESALYLLSCTQTWEPSPAARVRAGLLGGIAAYSRSGRREEEQAQIKAQSGKWSECPAFRIGVKYALTVNNTSDAQLDDGDEKEKPRKPVKLEYLGSASLAVLSDPAPALPEPQTPNVAGRAKVHFTSTPSGAEIFIDGKFFGNTPSDVTLPPGEHGVKVSLGGKDWARSLQITSGEISVHADIASEGH